MYKFTDNQKKNLLQWAEWLEITEKTQGSGSLKCRKKIYYEDSSTDKESNEINYCCLGVYIEQKYPDEFEKQPNIFGEYPCGYNVDGYINLSYLPIKCSRELGIYFLSSKIRKNRLQELFAFLNDEVGYSFKQIAVEIRSLVETGNFTENTREILQNHMR